MTSNGVKKALLIGILIFLPQFAFAGSQIYSTPGAHTFTVPTGVSSVNVVVVGGGGGGGGGNNGWGSGAGGGCGGTIAGTSMSVTPGQNIALNVGAGGVGGTTATNGAVGGTSNFGATSAEGGSWGRHGYYNLWGSYTGGYGGGSGGGGGGNGWRGFMGMSTSGGTAGSNDPYNADSSGGYCTGAGWAINPGTYITKASWSAGSGGQVPHQYSYNGGGGGGGLVIADSTVKGGTASGPCGWGCPGPGGAGYGGGGGGTGLDYYATGGSGAPGVVYVEWTDPPPALACTGSPETFSTPGTYTRTVPSFSTMIVEVWGGGGGGGGGAIDNVGEGGGSSSFYGSVIAHGGNGGTQRSTANQANDGSGKGGLGGSATGGDSNISGSSGLDGQYWGDGGASPNGGSGGAGTRSKKQAGDNGGSPGGGGGGGGIADPNPAPEKDYQGGGGGGGGYAKKTYASGQLSSTVTLVIGSGGTGAPWYQDDQSAGGNGAPGQVKIICFQNSPPTTPVVTGPTSGFTKTDYTYTFQSTDPDSDTIRYGIDWDGNGSIDEYAPALGYVSSGTSGSAVHSWNSSNTQTFKALAQDSLGNTSGWVSYTVNMSPNAPTVLLTATPDSIGSGESSTLTWSSENATSCTGTNFSTSGATTNTSPGVSVSPTQTTTYTVTCTGEGNQEASDSKTVTYTCTPVNQCSGQNVVNSCTGVVVQSCAYQCGAGACIPPPAPVPNPTGSGPASLTGHLQVRPPLVIMGDRTRVFWNISNVESCTATGDNTPADSWTVAGTLANNWTSASDPAGEQSAQITQRTTYTLSCTPFSGQSFTPENASVNVAPVFRER